MSSRFHIENRGQIIITVLNNVKSTSYEGVWKSIHDLYIYLLFHKLTQICVCIAGKFVTHINASVDNITLFIIKRYSTDSQVRDTTDFSSSLCSGQIFDSFSNLHSWHRLSSEVLFFSCPSTISSSTTVNIIFQY